MADDKFNFEYLGRLEGHNGSVTTLVVGNNEDGSPLLISGGRDKNIIVWKLNLNEPEDIKDSEQKVIDHKVGKPIKSLHGHNHFISSIALSNDNKKLISGSWDKTIRLWDLPTSSSQQLFKGHDKDVLTVSFSHDQRLIFSGGMDNSLIYWNSQGELKFRNDSFGGWVSSIINSKKGKENFMAVGSWDSKVRIFNNQYAIDRTIEGNGYAVTSMSTDDEGDYLFVAYKDGTVKVWNLKGNKNTEDICRRTIETNVNVNTINFQSKYFQVFAIGTNKGLQLRQIKSNKIYDTKIYVPCNCIAYDSTKTYLFAGYSDGVIRVFKFGMSE